RELAARDEVLLSCVDSAAEKRMKEEVDRALKTGDTVGGVFEVIAHGAPPGLGTYANWDERLDGRLAGAVMSLQAVKAVELGRGGRRSHGCACHCAGGAGRVRRRFARGSEAQLRGISRAVEELLNDLPHREIWRPGAASQGGAGHQLRRRA